MGLEFATLLSPVGAEQSGGDFYVIEPIGTRTVVIVGDVMGKGADAAPYAQRMRELVASRIREDHKPAELLATLNRDVCRDASFDRYVTACVMDLNPVDRSATWAFAGHLPPHWLDLGLPVDGAAPGYPLGLDEVCAARSAERRPLPPRAGFVLVTDGVEDVRGPGGDRFGTARITHLLATTLHGGSPEQVVDGLKTAVCEFGGGDLYDDICIVALRMD